MKTMAYWVRVVGFSVGLLGGVILPRTTWAQTPAAAETAVTTTAAPPVPATSADEASSIPPSSTVGPAPTEAPASAPTTEMDGATYRVRLRDLEQRVDELKEQIRRSHTRLSLLSDTILAGAGGGAKAEIVFENDLSGAWRLVEAVVVMDGVVQYKKSDDTGVLAAQKRIPIFSGSIPGGDHTVQVMIKLRGHGFGVFSYLRGVEATVKNDHSFTITDGKVMELRVVGWEQGGPTTPVEEQPSLRFIENLRSMGEAPTTPLATPSTAPQAQPTARETKVEPATTPGPAAVEAGGGVSLGGAP